MSIVKMHPPRVTVIVPCFNEQANIGEVLDALMRQTYPEDKFDIVVVDNGSTDNSPCIVKEYGIGLLQEKRRSSYRARNLGIANSRGELIAFLDGDCVPAIFWLEKLAQKSTAENIPLVAGRIENQIVRANLGNRLLAMRKTPEERKKSVLEHKLVPGGNFIVKREMFEKYGLFNEYVSGSDTEFSRRLFLNGEKIGYCEEAIVSHRCDISNFDYLLRAFRVRYGQEKNKKEKSILRNLSCIPVRPGIRAVPRFDGVSRLGRFGLWSFVYVERWFSYLGGVWGAI